MLDKFLKKSWNPLVFRILASIGFIFLLLILYYGSFNLIFNLEDNLVMFILWTLWWPFLYVTLFFFGRAWCGFICPIGLFNEMGNSIRNAKKDFLAKYIFLPFVLFFIIVFWEQVSGLFSSPKITLIFLSSFFASAFLMGVLFPRWGFCKHFCPIGTILGPFSRLSIIGVRTNQETCETCNTRECIRGGKYAPCPMFNYVPKLESNKDCLLCANCIKNCPHNSAKLDFVKPGKEIKDKKGFNLSESLFIIALIGFSVLLTSKGTNLLRFFEIPGSLLRLVDFTLGIGALILIYVLASIIATKMQRKQRVYDFKENLTMAGYASLPLAFSLMFFLIVFGFITPLTGISELWIAISKYIILGIGAVWSIKLAKNLFRKNSIVYVILIILITLFWVMVLIPGPLSVYSNDVNVYVVEAGEVVNLEAFSMGFNPGILKVKSGDEFSINITDNDIIHSFYIDELDIHIDLSRSQNKVIKIGALEKGEYKYYCDLPGHEEAGMKGLLIVE